MFLLLRRYKDSVWSATNITVTTKFTWEALSYYGTNVRIAQCNSLLPNSTTDLEFQYRKCWIWQGDQIQYFPTRVKVTWTMWRIGYLENVLLGAESSSEKRLSCRSKAALIGEIGASAAAVLEKWNELKPTKMTLNSYWEKVSKAGKAELIWASGSTDTGSSLQQHKQKLFQSIGNRGKQDVSRHCSLPQGFTRLHYAVSSTENIYVYLPLLIRLKPKQINKLMLHVKPFCFLSRPSLSASQKIPIK
mgnify:CR=1 FL=1